MSQPLFKINQAWILLMVWVIAFGFLYLISLSAEASELWTQTFARWIQLTLGPIVNLIPFSIAEWVFGITVAYLIVSLYKTIIIAFKRSWKRVGTRLLKVVNILGLTVTFYFSTAGIAYQRLPLPLSLYEQPVEKSSFDSIIRYFIDDFNATASRLTFDESGYLISPYSLQEINSLLQEAYTSLPEDYFTSFTPNAKPMLTSWLFTEFNITGVSIAITTEAMVNQLVPWSSIPFTMAHELAHAKGVMREEDANLVALYITLQSSNDFIRYSGYFSSISSLLNLAQYTGIVNHRQTLVNLIHPMIRNNFQAYGLFWENYQWLNELARAVNDFYLRILGNDGVISYVDEEETETIEEDGEIVEVIVSFSPYQKLYFHQFFS